MWIQYFEMKILCGKYAIQRYQINNHSKGFSNMGVLASRDLLRRQKMTSARNNILINTFILEKNPQNQDTTVPENDQGPLLPSQFLPELLLSKHEVNTTDKIATKYVWAPIWGGVSIRKMVLSGMVIPMFKIRRPNGRLIFNMGITIRR